METRRVIPSRLADSARRVLSTLARLAPRRSVRYAAWLDKRSPTEAELKEQSLRASTLQWKPSFDVLLRREAGDAHRYERTLASLRAQTYRRYVIREYQPQAGDGASAANRAVGEGDLIAFVTSGDILAPHALYAFASTQAADAGLFYSDEDVLRGDHHEQPFFKPAWSPDSLLSFDYVGGLCAIRRDLFHRIGGFRRAGDEEQLDVLLRLTPFLKRVVHVAEVLYHRVGALPHFRTAVVSVVRSHLETTLGDAYRVSENGVVTFQPRNPPRVAVIVPTRDHVELLQACVDSLDRLPNAARAELLVIDTGSVEVAAREYLVALAKRPDTRVLHDDRPFNWSAVNNRAVRECDAEYVLFLNNDVEALTPAWMDALLAFASRPEIGAVGAQLVYPDGTIQHTGVVLGLTGYAGHVLAGRPPQERTPFGPADMIRDCTAVTGACMMLRRRLFEELGGFDERFILCGSDVELCLRAIGRGYRNVVTPHARLLHRESKTRGTHIPRSDYERSFAVYERYLREGDPYYNRNLSLKQPSVELRTGPEDMIAVARRYL